MENMNQLGFGLEKMEQQISNKYNLSFSNNVIITNITRLTNQIWKLIPMRENNEDWKKQLETVTLEIVGLNNIFISDPLFLQLIAKLEGLFYQETSFNLYRKTVFETINLLQELKKKYEQK